MHEWDGSEPEKTNLAYNRKWDAKRNPARNEMGWLDDVENHVLIAKGANIRK